MANNEHVKKPEIPKATLGDMPQDLWHMHHKFDFHNVAITKGQLKGRLDFLQEELDEAYKALEENHAPDFVDAHIDLMVVAIGTLDLARVNIWEAWDEVHFANMSKERGSNNKRHNMKGMDLRKPEGWQAPDHSRNVGILPTILQRAEEYKEEMDKVAQRIGLVEQRRRAIQFLEQCKEVMLKKADDYNWPGSEVRTADYYPRGLDDLFHMIHIKYLRAMSIVAKMRSNTEIQNEDLRETLRDLAVFSAMTVEFLDGEMDGQDSNKDLFGNVKAND